MKAYLIASLVIAGLATPALAAESAPHYIVKDTVGNCSVIDVHPSKVEHLKILGQAQGYGSKSAAEQALRGISGCSA